MSSDEDRVIDSFQNEVTVSMGCAPNDSLVGGVGGEEEMERLAQPEERRGDRRWRDLQGRWI